MDCEASAQDLLEGILLDENKEPADFPMWLLQSITDNFSKDHNIGSGGFADVYKGQLKCGIVAVKKLKEPSEKIEDLVLHEKKFMQEVDCLMKVKHKNIVRFLGYCYGTHGKLLEHMGKNIMAEKQQRLLCFEFVPQGSLDKYITDASNGLEWRTRYHIIKGICEGLQYLHGKKIVHADLKPQNILLDHNMVPKIGDFGLARKFLEEQTSAITKNIVGTRGYMAPECLQGVITFASDIYSLGIIIIEMLTGEKKYDISIENVRENWIARFETSHEGTWLEHVTVCGVIGLDCMDIDPKKRPTIGKIIDRLGELEHKYASFGTGLPFPAIQHFIPVELYRERGSIYGIDVHPTEAWLLVAYVAKRPYVSIWNYETQKEVTKFEVKYLKEENFIFDLSSIKFIAGEQWFAAGDDKGGVHVYSYTSFGAEMVKVKEFEAHSRYTKVSYLAVYPKHTLLLTACSRSIKLWDWSQGWTCARVINIGEHNYFKLTVGRMDASTFAIIYDREVKVWDIHSPDAIATFEGVWSTFCTDGHGDFLAATSHDRKTVKIWDLQTKKHIHTLICPGFKSWEIITNIACHPTLPILACTVDRSSSNEVHKIVLWDLRTYRILKGIEVLMKGDYPEMLFDGSEDITSLVVASKEEISVIKINVAILLTGHSK